MTPNDLDAIRARVESLHPATVPALVSDALALCDEVKSLRAEVKATDAALRTASEGWGDALRLIEDTDGLRALIAGLRTALKNARTAEGMARREASRARMEQATAHERKAREILRAYCEDASVGDFGDPLAVSAIVEPDAALRGEA